MNILGKTDGLTLYLAGLLLSLLLFLYPAGSTLAQQGCFSTQFDGIDDSIEIPDSPSLSPLGQITVELWAKPFALGDEYRTYVAKANSETSWSYMLEYPGIDAGPEVAGKVVFSIFADGQRHDVLTTNLLSPYLNTWVHIAGTYDGLNLRIYLNGQLEGTASASGIINTDNGPVAFGHWPGCANYHLGLIDEVRIWGIARTQAEIQATMNQMLSGTETGLAGYWPMDEGTGITASDTSANGNHGTLLNGTAWSTDTAPVTCGGGGGGGGGEEIAEPSTAVLLGLILALFTLVHPAVREYIWIFRF